MPRLKVALISLARRGGMVHYQSELANALRSIVTVQVVCASEVSGSHLSNPVKSLRISTGRGPLGSFLRAASPVTWFRLLKSVRGTDADIYHIVGPHEWNPLLAVIIKVLRRPLIYTNHDPVPHRGAPLRMRLSNALVSRMADALVVLTRYGRDQLISAGADEKKVFCIPLGVYSLLVRHRAETRPENMLLFFGRIEPYKGLGLLRSAFRTLREELPDWKLVIAGPGSIADGASAADDSRIEIINRYLSDQEVAHLLPRARLVVLPYLEATQSAVIATAYAFGKPVIVTRVGGLSEMVVQGKTGLVIAPGDADVLARTILHLAKNPRRLKRMAALAREYGRRRWSWKRISRKHAAMYRAVLRAGTWA